MLELRCLQMHLFWLVWVRAQLLPTLNYLPIWYIKFFPLLLNLYNCHALTALCTALTLHLCQFCSAVALHTPRSFTKMEQFVDLLKCIICFVMTFQCFSYGERDNVATWFLLSAFAEIGVCMGVSFWTDPMSSAVRVTNLLPTLTSLMQLDTALIKND